VRNIWQLSEPDSLKQPPNTKKHTTAAYTEAFKALQKLTGREESEHKKRPSRSSDGLPDLALRRKLSDES
jgi:hypothetical protein